MAKVERGVPKPEPVTVPDAFLISIDACVSVEELGALWQDAIKQGFSETVQELFTKRKKVIANETK